MIWLVTILNSIFILLTLFLVNMALKEQGKLNEALVKLLEMRRIKEHLDKEYDRIKEAARNE